MARFLFPCIIFLALTIIDGYKLIPKNYNFINLVRSRIYGSDNGIINPISDNHDPSKFEEVWNKFMKSVVDYDSNRYSSDFEEEYNGYKLHNSLIFQLVRSDLDKKLDDSTMPRLLPFEYIFVLQQIFELINKRHSLHNIIKTIVKKESMGSLMNEIITSPNLKYSPRRVVEYKRKVERILSMTCILLLSYKDNIIYNQSDNNEELAYFCKPVIEKLSFYEKHFAFLVLFRGLYNPGYKLSYPKHQHDIQVLIRSPEKSGLISLMKSFKNNIEYFNIPNPTSSSTMRLLYPYLIAASRAYYYSQYNQNLLNNNDDKTNANSHNFIELKVTAFLLVCSLSDETFANNNHIHDIGNEIQLTLLRFVLDMIAKSFINDDFGQAANFDTIAEEIRKNTLAMELVCTSKTFCEDHKNERFSFSKIMVKIGRYLDFIISNIIPIRYDEKETNIKLFIENFEATRTVEKCIEITSLVKKSMALISISKNLSPMNQVRKRIESIIGLSPITKLTSYIITPPFIQNTIKSDSQFWNEPIKNKNNYNTKNDYNNHNNENNNTSFIEINKKVDKCLIRLMLELLDADNSLATNDTIIAEINDVYSTWRKPQLLLEYLFMHSSTPEIVILYKRFLRALFGISHETVDDIRHKDHNNINHFKNMDPDLVNEWMEGRTSDGIILPGFNDPQTIFCMGEDSLTCLSIRARQKGSNRGLLSILLNGNCRVIGVKDLSGRLVARSLVRLLIDEDTNRPVLYVESPYGNGKNDELVEVYDQAAELGTLLRLPIIYASAPSPDDYIMKDFELSAVYNRTHMTHDESFTYDPINYSNLTDYSTVAKYVWINGIMNDENDFLPDRIPTIIKRDKNNTYNSIGKGIAIGMRVKGSLENIKNNYLRGAYVRNTNEVSIMESINNSFEKDGLINQLQEQVNGKEMKKRMNINNSFIPKLPRKSNGQNRTK
eukprot:gene4544-6415_t